MSNAKTKKNGFEFERDLCASILDMHGDNAANALIECYMALGVRLSSHLNRADVHALLDKAFTMVDFGSKKTPQQTNLKLIN